MPEKFSNELQEKSSKEFIKNIKKNKFEGIFDQLLKKCWKELPKISKVITKFSKKKKLPDEIFKAIFEVSYMEIAKGIRNCCRNFLT